MYKTSFQSCFVVLYFPFNFFLIRRSSCMFSIILIRSKAEPMIFARILRMHHSMMLHEGFISLSIQDISGFVQNKRYNIKKNSAY